MQKSCIPYIPYQSLLLSTTVLNDISFQNQLNQQIEQLNSEVIEIEKKVRSFTVRIYT